MDKNAHCTLERQNAPRIDIKTLNLIGSIGVKFISELEKRIPMQQDLEKLIAETDSFFHLHWNKEALGAPPAWVAWDTFLDGSVPNYQYGGCYALFSGDQLIYIGLGASRGGGIYQRHGISRRLMAHVLRSDVTSGPTRSKLLDRWVDISSLWTLGFPSNDYLAPALESFLIRSLTPPKNARV